MKMMFPSHKDSIILDADVRDAIKALKWLEEKGYTDAVFVVGSDRVPAFQFIKQYNGKDYNMNTVEIRSAGERDPDADDVSGMSASKVRKAIVDGDLEIVASALPNSVKNDASFKKDVYSSSLIGDVIMAFNLIAEERTIDNDIDIDIPATRIRRMLKLVHVAVWSCIQ